MLDQCEVLLYQAEQELISAGAGALITPIVGDVTDVDRMRDVFVRFKPELVLHAAAHKHVPMMESQPSEALKNNVLGTEVVARLAAEHRAAKFVLISSDKAVNPTNVMGASKRLAERVVRTKPGARRLSWRCDLVTSLDPPAQSFRFSAARSPQADPSP
jgi:FlaA1/EpsC-like NDP-sugar epimerase